MSFRRRNRELDDEIAAHVRMALRDRLDRGEPYDEAVRAVRREFGNEAAVKEVTRGMWGWTWIETLFSDFRYALRGIAKSPAWAAAVAISLAFGVGANTAIFSLTYAIILKNLPIPQPSRLIRYGFRNGAQDIGLSGPVYDSLRRHQSISTDLLAWGDADFSLDENGQAARIQGALLSGTGFRVLRLQPFLGTAFGDADDVPGGGPRGYQAVLSYAWWKSHFHQDPSVVGRTLRVNGRAVTIAGVLPPGFEGLSAGNTASILLPLAFDEVVHASQPLRLHQGSFWLGIFGRLKPGQSIDSARANLAAIESSVRKEADSKGIYLGGFFKPFHFTVESGSGGRSFLRPLYQRPLLVLEMLAALVLVLCCANTALLVLAQMSSRSREFALRIALGAPRLRIFRLVLLEILVLAAAGLLVATLLGWSLAQSLTAMLAVVDYAPDVDVTPRAVILGFTAALTLAAALGSGLFSAIRVSKSHPAAALKQGRTATSRRAAGRWIIPAQVAVSVTLIASALLLGASFLHLYLTHPGFQPSGLLLADVDLHAAKFKTAETAQAIHQITSSLSAASGITAAAYLSVPPIRDWWSAGHYFAVDRRGAVHTDQSVWPETVSSGYFNAMGTRLLQGQFFPKEALASDRTCILSENAARYFFPGDSAVGQLVYSGGGNQAQADGSRLDPADSCRVIGIVENVPFRSLREAPPRMIYRILADEDADARFSVAIRTANDSQAAAALRDVMRRVAPSVPAPTLYPFAELIDTHLNKERMLIRLSTCFGGCALLLTAIGLYGLLMRSITERTQEIGIRMALGASRRSAVASVIGLALRQVVFGLIAGGALALAVARAMSSLLYGITPRDPRIYLGSILVLLLTALLATLIPARRAASIDPAAALRTE